MAYFQALSTPIIAYIYKIVNRGRGWVAAFYASQKSFRYLIRIRIFACAPIYTCAMKQVYRRRTAEEKNFQKALDKVKIVCYTAYT